MRRSFQQAMEAEFRRVVEEATGRKVIAYMSSIHVDPDLAVELFVLEPVEEGAEADPECGWARGGAPADRPAGVDQRRPGPGRPPGHRSTPMRGVERPR